jgi:hypothetical protein
VRFIVLDSGESGADDWHENSGLTDFRAYHLRQAEWLRREVAGPAFAEAGYRVVFVHIPIDPASDRGKPHESDSYRSEIGRILEEAGASLMVAGHTHMPALREPVPGKRGFPIMTGGDWNMARGNASTIRLRADAKCLIAELFLFGKEGDGRLARRIEIAPTRRLRTMVRAGDQAERDMGDAGGAASRSACR